MTQRPSVVVFFGSLIVFRLALDYGCINYVSLKYESSFLPIIYRWDSFQYALSLAFYCASLWALRPYQHSAGNIFQLMASIFVVAPLTSQYGLDFQKPFEPVLATIAALFVVRWISEIKLSQNRKFIALEDGRLYALVMCLSGIAYLIIWTVVSGAVRSFNLDPELVYEFRTGVSNLLDVGPLAYLNLWVYKSFSIYLICVALERKKYYWILPIMAVQIYFAGVTAHKGIIFLPLIAICFWYFLTRFQNLYPLPLGLAAIVILSLSITLNFEFDWASELMVRRTFFVPSSLTFAWFDYFDHQPFVFWSDTLLSRFHNTIYTNGPKIPYVVGEWLLPGNELAANNGMVSTGYSHAGYAGILFYAVILGLIVKFFNSLCETGVPIWIVTVLSVGPLRTAIGDADLPTAFLSHGIMISMLLSWLHRRRRAAVRGFELAQPGYTEYRQPRVINRR